ncbi:helix-turn-helix domain-containing protein [Bariatricus sp. HCP28S3_A7]|uniref:helix-turn-helix domain-containing protein n=1 Tax=Bariatricus sp. HCP28S3_A7 TaxID=3438894 RepID=UPI002A932E7D|nr:helix-turn-helix transcriptional regulator [bacterium]MDY5458012.1 helix-turn-helix transcriptional regulator [Bariatricus sp.]
MNECGDLRQDNDYTQEYVAKYLGVAQNTYSQYESDKRPIPLEYIVALCDLYEVSADYLLGRVDKK